MKLIVEITDRQWQNIQEGIWCGSEEIAKGVPLSNQWIKPRDKLPEQHEYILTVIRVGNREPKIRSGTYHDGLFSNDNGDVWRATDPEVVAWRPQPIYEETE